MNRPSGHRISKPVSRIQEAFRLGSPPPVIELYLITAFSFRHSFLHHLKKSLTCQAPGRQKKKQHCRFKMKDRKMLPKETVSSFPQPGKQAVCNSSCQKQPRQCLFPLAFLQRKCRLYHQSAGCRYQNHPQNKKPRTLYSFYNPYPEPQP